MTRHGSSCPAAGMQEESDLEQEQLRLMLKASKDRCEAEQQEETKHLPHSLLGPSCWHPPGPEVEGAA